MKLDKILSYAAAAAVCAAALYAQDSEKKLLPDFYGDVEVSAGAANLDGCRTIETVPGISSKGLDSDLRLNVTGSFIRASSWRMDKEDGIKQKSGIGYETGLTVNMAKLYEAAADKPDTSSSDSDCYSLVQPMIDWYESRRAVYGLPYNPCNTADGSPWPTTAYGGSSVRYQFIKGASAERSDDVEWTSAKWADAQALYYEIKNDISTKIDELYAGNLSTGDVSQFTYEKLSEEQKRKAEKKQHAIKEFNNIAGGTSSGAAVSAVSEAWFKITNIAHVMDIRADFTGRRLSVGETIYSALAGTTCSGSALTVSLKNGLVPGFTASAAVGVAGGEKQTAENWDTEALDYWPGIASEVALRGAVRYNTFFDNLQSSLDIQMQGIAEDMAVATENYAVDAGISWQTYGPLSCAVGAESLVLNWRDREDDSGSAETAWSAAVNAGAAVYGADIKAEAAYKTKHFSSAVTDSAEDRFYGTACSGDYETADIQPACMYRITAAYNPEYLTARDIVTVSGGIESFLYGNPLAVCGTGFFSEIKTRLDDVCFIPLCFYGKMSYYRNTGLTEWNDMNSLAGRTFSECTRWKAGMTYKPVKKLQISAEYASTPSGYRRVTERISSLTVTGRISF